jgi:hypothetical protein
MTRKLSVSLCVFRAPLKGFLTWIPEARFLQHESSFLLLLVVCYSMGEQIKLQLWLPGGARTGFAYFAGMGWAGDWASPPPPGRGLSLYCDLCCVTQRHFRCNSVNTDIGLFRKQMIAARKWSGSQGAISGPLLHTYNGTSARRVARDRTHLARASSSEA